MNPLSSFDGQSSSSYTGKRKNSEQSQPSLNDRVNIASQSHIPIVSNQEGYPVQYEKALKILNSFITPKQIKSSQNNVSKEENYSIHITTGENLNAILTINGIKFQILLNQDKISSFLKFKNLVERTPKNYSYYLSTDYSPGFTFQSIEGNSSIILPYTYLFLFVKDGHLILSKYITEILSYNKENSVILIENEIQAIQKANKRVTAICGPVSVPNFDLALKNLITRQKRMATSSQRRGELKSIAPEIPKTEQVYFPQTVNKQELKRLFSEYMHFYSTLRLYLKDPEAGKGLRAVLAKEGGFFGFTHTLESDVANVITMIFNQGVGKTWSGKLKNWILQDFLSFFSVDTKIDYHSLFSRFQHTIEVNRRQKKAILDGRIILDEKTMGAVLESFLKIKLAEYKLHIKVQCGRAKPSETEARIIPCYFIHYAQGCPLLKPLHAYFDDKDTLRGLFADNGEARSYLSKVWNIESAGEEILPTEENLELLRKILSQVSSDKELPFILLEEKSFHPTIEKTKQKEKAKKRLKSETISNAVSQSSSVSPEDATRLSNVKTVANVKQQNSYSLTQALPKMFESISAVGFWQKASLQQCQKAQEKSKKGKAPHFHGQALPWRIPNLPHLLNGNPRTLYMLQAKPYQQTGINKIAALRERGVAGILGWRMGLGKTLGIEEFLMEHIVSGEGSMLVITPNPIRSQVMLEVKVRFEKAQFAALLASAFHANECEGYPKRLEEIRQFITRAFPGWKAPGFKRIFL